MSINSRIPGFYKLSPGERLKKVLETCGLAEEDLTRIGRTDEAMLSIADHMIENVVATLPIPVGIAANFTVNGRDYLVPMATEEPSVVAAASNMAAVARLNGGFTTSSSQPIMIAQVQVVDVEDPHAARLRLYEHRQELLDLANEQDPFLVKVGGGAKDIEVRIVAAGAATFVVLHLIVDVRDAMGANAVNTMAEALAPTVSRIAQGRVLLRILSNKADRRLARVRATYDRDALGGAEVVEGILNAYAFAAADPYRAATHNKGIMNGIDPLAIATGNDWRALEAGAHAYAARDGQYRALTDWRLLTGEEGEPALAGRIELPLAVGIVGGATKAHPTAQAALKILGVTSARQLAEVMAAVGLAQNLSALRALAAEGIQAGHMALHARHVALAAGAPPDLVEQVAAQLIAEGQIRAARAAEILATRADD